MRELKPELKKNQYTTFKAKIVRFSYLPHKELVLLTNVKYFDLKQGFWKILRDHVWVENFLESKKGVQGKEVIFSGSLYEYKNSKEIKQQGVEPTKELVVFKYTNKNKKNIYSVKNI